MLANQGLGGTATGRGRRSVGIAIAAVLIVTAVGMGGAAFERTADAATPAGTMTVSLYSSPSPAGSTIDVSGTECVSTTGAAAVLVSLDTPSGESIAGTVATPYVDSGSYSGEWYASLAIPITAAPSSDYTVTA
jgi:hypothetical protein